MKKKSVFDLYNDLKDKVALTLVTEWDRELLIRRKLSKYILRPGLALTGFFNHFESDRIQLIGETELLFLQSIENDESKKDNVKEFFKFDIPMIVVAKRKRVPSYFIEYGNKYNVPIFQTYEDTDSIYLILRQYLDRVMTKTANVPASLISVYNVGILIQGDEGFGKSETSLELIKNGHQFVCDENVFLWNNNGTVIGEASKDKNGNRYYPLKIRGIGEIRIDKVFGVQSILENKEVNIRVIFSVDDYDVIEGTKDNFITEGESLIGVEIPTVYINIKTNKNIASLIEMLAIQYLSKYVFKEKK